MVRDESHTPFLLPFLVSALYSYFYRVRNAAFQHLGPFIAALSSEKVSPSLLNYFLNMANSGSSSLHQIFPHTPDASGDNDLILFCAFSFPAVTLTLGRERWGELRSTFQILEKDMMWKVRRTLSHSLHEIARILGPALTESELLSSFDLFLRDLDEVKVGVLAHLADFFAALNPEAREKYLMTIVEIKNSNTPLNWRFRELLASQIAPLCILFSSKSVFEVMMPLIFELLTDPVYAVKEATIPSVIVLIKILGRDNKAWQEVALKKLLEFQASRIYSERTVSLTIIFS
jgi:serine/threonine-protein phosphatase 4 regulatory subunit 1